MAIPKKKLSEIKTRLRREPKVREVYVEGIFDRDFYKWILSKLEIEDVKVYPISVIDISEEMLKNNGLTNGERQKVQAAAFDFVIEVDLHKQILFLIDADLDYLLERAEYTPPLRITSGTSAELILWKKNTLEKFFSLALGCDSPERLASEIMNFVEPIVTSLCEFRAAKEILGENWKLIDIEDCFGRNKNFSFEDFCTKVADKNSARAEMRDNFPAALTKIKQKSRDLPSCQKMHGHDLFAALGKKLQLEGHKKQFLNSFDEFTRLVMASLEWSHIQEDATVNIISKTFKPSHAVN